MTKVNKQGSQKQEADTGSVTPKDTANKGKQSGKGNRPRVGGRAVPGAKSTQSKQISTTNNPQQQQMESMNRDMRRRMQRLGTDPTTQASSLQDQRKKRLERRKQRIDERKQEIKKVAARGPRNITLGRRNTYFLIAVAVFIILFIIVALVVNHFGVR